LNAKKEINKSNEIAERSLIEKAFVSDFIKDQDHDFYEDLKTYLEKCTKKWTAGEHFAPIVSICQSSGTGKSKCMYEFAKTHFCVFICARKKEEGSILDFFSILFFKLNTIK